ncbi:hypothetical protein ACWD4G_06055 [Streptomyces sp. NPDC002643]
MVSATAHDIEATAESLQADLARLKVQKEALERELAAVSAHLGSVRRALGALEPLMRAQTATASEPQVGPASGDPRVKSAAGEPKGEHASSAPRVETVSAEPVDTDGRKSYGRLTEQIMEYFAGLGDVDVRARDVAAALGRDTDSGSINGVRSTLDRLVGASRVERAGRGLYRARRS